MVLGGFRWFQVVPRFSKYVVRSVFILFACFVLFFDIVHCNSLCCFNI